MDVFDKIEKLFESFLERLSPPPPRRVIVVAVPTEATPMPTPVPPVKFQVTLDQLRKVMPLCPLAKATAYHPLMQRAMEEFEITNPLRAAAFLAQIAHESGQFRYFEEIADGSAYENRKDLGNVLPGDGKRYKGRGPIQLTGRTNYRDFGKELGLDLENEPKLAAMPEVGFRTACCFWKRKGLNALADNGEFKAITKKINGGYNHLDERIKYYTIAKDVLGAT